MMLDFRQDMAHLEWLEVAWGLAFVRLGVLSVRFLTLSGLLLCA